MTLRHAYLLMYNISASVDYGLDSLVWFFAPPTAWFPSVMMGRHIRGKCLENPEVQREKGVRLH